MGFGEYYTQTAYISHTVKQSDSSIENERTWLFQNMSMWKRQALESAVAIRVDNLNLLHVVDKLSGSKTMWSSEGS